MSRKLGAFNPASTATTSILTVTSAVSLYLPFDTDFSDLSNFNHTPTVAGDTNIQTSTAQFGGSAFFDGNDDYVTYPNHSSFLFGTEDFTVEGFYNASSVGSDGLLGIWGGSSSGLRCWLISFSLSRLYAAFSLDGNSATSLNSGVNVSTGQWYNFAFTREGSTFRLFLDGVLKATATNSGGLKNSSQNLAIGSNNQSLTTLEYHGFLDDIRITKGLAVYTTAYSVPTSPVGFITDTRSHSHVWNYSDIYKARRADTWPDLVYDTQIALYLPFNGSLTDFSSYGHTVSAVGDAAVTTSPFQFHASCAFDGNGDLLTVPHNNIFDFGGNDFTIEGFINPTTAAGVQGVYSQWGGTGSRSFKVVISTNAKLEINGSKDGSTGTQVNQIASTGLELNTFSHFAVTREGSNFRIFINGVNRGTTTDSGALYNSSANIAIGGNRADQTTNTLHGNLEDFRVVNGLALYTTAFEVPTRSINNTLTVNP